VPWFVIGPAYFIATVAALIVLFRTRWNRSPFLSIAAAAAACLVSGGALFVLRLAAAPGSGDAASAADIFYGLVCYVWLLFAFMETYYTLNTSVSLRVVSEIAASGGAMTLDELKARYSYTWMIGQRLRMLAAGGLVQERGGRFAATPKAAHLCRLFIFVKRSLRLGESG
jgi:hypothetical protein